jgi:hypothetical protein
MKGNVLSNRVAFIVMIPGLPQLGQSRLLSPNLGGADQYLDDINVPACAAPCVPGTYRNYDANESFIMGDEHRWIDDPGNPGKQIEDTSYKFNDKLIYVTIDELMPLIEKRIAREVKACLDEYAAAPVPTNGNLPSLRYPWASSATDTATFATRFGTYNVRFGRISEIPNLSTTSGGTPPTGALLTNIQAVQTTLNIYIANQTAGNLTNLNIAGQTLETYAPSGPANAAGDTAKDCADMTCTATLQSELNTAMGMVLPDPTMPSTWTTACNSLFTSPTSYWADWRDLVFYQVAEGYRPGGGAFTALQISGSGNSNSGSGATYRAAVIVAGKKLGTQTRPTSTTPPNNYLANVTLETDPGSVINAHNDSGSNTSFITYKTTDPFYQSVNDLVICVDGKNNCK